MTTGTSITIGLAGNPNAGKSSLFNKITGMRVHVGNYPGVTVEKKWAEIKHKSYNITVVDLPGTYSLNSYSLDERVARDFIINERPDMIVNVIDSTNLERNLYLTMQVLELGVPAILAMNMMDVCESQGIHIDLDKLEEGLNVKAVPIIATTGSGLDKLLDTIIEVAEKKTTQEPLMINYGQDVNKALASIEELFEKSKLADGRVPISWLAKKYLEGDPAVCEQVRLQTPEVEKASKPIRDKLSEHLKTTVDDEIEGVMTDYRYGYLTGLCRTILTRTRKDTRGISDAIDRVLLNRLMAPIFFLAVVYCLYEFTFWASGPVVSLFESLFTSLGHVVENNMDEGLFKNLIMEGLIGGVGGVIGFAPLIAFMFIGISVLEDSGYMARVAFILDRIFRAFGLHGNSVVALIVGGGIAGGCAIPGVMAARTLRDPKERIATILVTPFMTCGAKLPVFLMLVAAFFKDNATTIMMGLTLFAWCIALISAKILRIFVLPGAPSPFVLELPPYRLPTISGVLLHAWERTWDYLKRAGTVIVAITIVIWLMMTFPRLPASQAEPFINQISMINTQLEEAQNSGADDHLIAELESSLAESEAAFGAAGLRNSIAGRIGQSLEPVSKLIGFDWRTNIALVGGFAAKEVVLSTLGTAYAIGGDAEGDNSEDDLIQSLSASLAHDSNWSPLSAITLMVFVLIYAPCFVTIIVIGREIGYKWALFSLVGSTVYAFLISLVIFQGGRILGIGLA